MSALLPDDTSGAPEGAKRVTPDEAVLRRVTTRAVWLAEPVVRLRHLPDADALVVEIVPLPAETDRVIEELLCIEFDGTDPHALPTSLCLTRLTARPDSPAARCAQHVMGKTLWPAVQGMLRHGITERVVSLDEAVLESRMRAWRRLAGLAVGVEVQPGALRAALVGGDGEIITTAESTVDDMSPLGMVSGIAGLIAGLRAEHAALICGAPLVVGVQIAGPVDHDTGVVHYFHKRSRHGSADWGWDEVPFAAMLGPALGLPVNVLNDVVAYAELERFQHPVTDSLCAVLLIAQGIGGTLIRNGEVDTRMPMEVGNIVLHENGRECDCGGRGCLEASAGTLAIVEEVARVTGRAVETIGDAVAAAELDGAPVDQHALDVFRAAGRDLARMIGIVQAIANPDSWVVYGPEELLRTDSVARNEFFAGLKRFDRFVSYKPYQNTAVHLHAIEGDEGAHGAAIAALLNAGFLHVPRLGGGSQRRNRDDTESERVPG